MLVLLCAIAKVTVKFYGKPLDFIRSARKIIVRCKRFVQQRKWPRPDQARHLCTSTYPSPSLSSGLAGPVMQIQTPNDCRLIPLGGTKRRQREVALNVM